jgi:hypothetical protein
MFLHPVSEGRRWYSQNLCGPALTCDQTFGHLKVSAGDSYGAEVDDIHGLFKIYESGEGGSVLGPLSELIDWTVREPHPLADH